MSDSKTPSARPEKRGVTALRRFFFPVLAFSPAIMMLFWINSCAVNVPFWDDWERGVLLQKFYGGTLSFKDLYAPHIDHRMLFPRLLILALNELSGGDLRWEMACSFGFVVLAALGLCALARATVFEGQMNWNVIFAVNLIVFTPMQWDNWLWGIQIAFMLPMTCLIWALVVALKPWIWWKRLAICLTLAVLATHSFGHGFVVWPAIFCLVSLKGELAMTQRQRLSFLGGWLLLGTWVIACYLLLDFTNTSHHSHAYGQAAGEPPPSVVHASALQSNLLIVAKYLCVLAGNPFARQHLVDPLLLAGNVGLAMLVAFLVLGIWVLWQSFHRRAVWERALPWLALGFSTLVGMAAIAAGRSNLIGLSRATSSRYNSMSLYLAVALLFLLVIWFRHSRFWARWSEVKKAQLGVMAVALFTGYSVSLWNYGGQMMRLCHDARLQGKAALQFIRFWAPEHVFRLDGEAGFLKQMAAFLDEHQLLSPPLCTHLALDQFKISETPCSKGQAKIEHFEVVGEGKFALAGYAKIKSRAADGVLFTLQVDGADPEIFAMAEPTSAMVNQLYPGELEMVGRIRPGIWDFCKWEKYFSLADLKGFDPETMEKAVVKCWVFDVKKLRAYRIRGELIVGRDGTCEFRD